MTRLIVVAFLLTCLNTFVFSSDSADKIGIFYIKSKGNYCILVLRNNLFPIYYGQCLNSELVLLREDDKNNQRSVAIGKYTNFNGIFMDISLTPLNIQPYELSIGSGVRMLKEGKIVHSLDEIKVQFQFNDDRDFISIEKATILPVLPDSINQIIEMVENKMKDKIIDDKVKGVIP